MVIIYRRIKENLQPIYKFHGYQIRSQGDGYESITLSI